MEFRIDEEVPLRYKYHLDRNITEIEKRLRQDGFSGTASSIFSILQKILKIILQKILKNPSRSYKKII